MNPAELTTFEVLKDWDELLYFFSGLGLLVVAGFGLYHLTLAKEQIESATKIFRNQSIMTSY